MTQGRPKKPQNLNKLHGNPGKRKKQPQTLTESTGKFGLPRGLHNTIKRHCGAVAKYLIKSGVPIDFVRPIFDRYCRHLQLSYEAYELTRQTEPSGDESETIFLGMKARAEKKFKDNSESALKIEKQLESIVKNGRPPEKKADPLEEFLSKGGRKGDPQLKAVKK